MAATVVCVLRSGGEYKPTHVQALARQVDGLVCLSDVPVPGVPTIPLSHDWPGWWSKMCAFNPELIQGDLLLMDLDTVVLGSIDHLVAIGKTTMLSDFYYPERAASGLMYLTEDDRGAVWDRWMTTPERHMASCGSLGDQKFVGDCLPRAARWQDEFPGQIVSYKVHVCTRQQSRRGIGNGSLPEGARVVCFHGQPRPWAVRADWIPDYD